MSDSDTGRQREWERIVARYREGDVIAGLVTREVNGGLLLNVGTVDDFAVFLPASQIDTCRPADLASYVGKSLECKILKIDTTRPNLVVSRRRLLAEKRTGHR
jgi:small subunit ribosomal protein S1